MERVDMLQRLHIVLFALSCLVVPPAFGQPRPIPPAPLISKATVAGLESAVPTISVEGQNFSNPKVFFGAAGGVFQQLTVLQSTNTMIVAALNSTNAGSYVVFVQVGDQTAGLTVTLGAVGPAGPQGPAGIVNGGFWSIAHTPLETTEALSISGRSLGVSPEFPSTLTFIANSCTMSINAYSTIAGATLTLRSSTSPVGPFINTALSCVASGSNSAMACSSSIPIAANSFVNFAYSGGAAPSGIFTYVMCN